RPLPPRPPYQRKDGVANRNGLRPNGWVSSSLDHHRRGPQTRRDGPQVPPTSLTGGGVPEGGACPPLPQPAPASRPAPRRHPGGTATSPAARRPLAEGTGPGRAAGG